MRARAEAEEAEARNTATKVDEAELNRLKEENRVMRERLRRRKMKKSKEN